MLDAITQPLRRIVVKVGSAVVAPGGHVALDAIDRLTADIAAARDKGIQVVLVSSGSVAAGFRVLGLDAMPDRLSRKQAAAAAGQPRLMVAYSEAFNARGIKTAQVLLTADDLDDRTRFLYARHTLDEVLDAGLVPVVNENDSVSHEGLHFGDNDRLAALVAGLVDADLQVIMSRTDGLRRGGPEGERIDRITSIADALTHADDSRSDTGTGGMKTKLDSVGIAAAFGVPTVVMRGPNDERPDPLARLLAGEPCGTVFHLEHEPRPGAKKWWIGHATNVRGAIVVDEGARRAIVERGASLLPKGVLGVERDFAAGAAVDIRTPAGPPFARGLANYAAADIDRLRGIHASAISAVLGYCYADEIVHRDDLAVLEVPTTPTPPTPEIQR